MAQVELYLELEPIPSEYNKDWVVGANHVKTRATRPKIVSNTENRWIKVVLDIDHEDLFGGDPQTYNWLGVEMPTVYAEWHEEESKDGS